MKLRHLALPLALLSALFLSGVQGHAQTPNPPAQAEPAPTEAPAEAKGEAKEEAKEEHAAPVLLFGTELGNIGKFVVTLVNFAIFFAALFFLLKGALASAFKARARELQEQLEQAGKDKAEGEAQMQALEAKMAGMQVELEGIMAKAETDAESEKQRILEAARAEAAQVLAQAQSEIDFQRRLAEKELRALVAELAVEGATQRLQAQVQGKVAETVLDRAIQEVGGAK